MVGKIEISNPKWLRVFAKISPPLYVRGPRGSELASQELLDAMGRHGRRIWQDEEAARYLDYFGAEASSANATDITLRPDARKIEALEEFLHGTQRRLGLEEMGILRMEIHVKDFMIRHQTILGISDYDIAIVKKSLKQYIERLKKPWKYRRRF